MKMTTQTHYVVSCNYVWQLTDEQFRKITTEIETKGRIGNLNLYGNYLGRIEKQTAAIRREAVELGSPRKAPSKPWLLQSEVKS
jgi:hypothetical protein